jgi:hypothetical protein
LNMRRSGLVVLFLVLGVAKAEAHGAARGFVLLLPTGHVIFIGAFVVLATFCIISLLPKWHFRTDVKPSAPLRSYKGSVASLISAFTLGILIWIGFQGPRDPAENLLTLVVWTGWWVVIVLLHPLVGNLWSYINPFSGIHGYATVRPLMRYPAFLSYWPAFLTFAGFSWFQLVYPSPHDPSQLAILVLAYFLLTLSATYVFGPSAWLAKGDPFAVFMFQLGACSPLNLGAKPRYWLPGIGLTALAPLTLSGVLFILLTLASISFDGFANTFAWLGAIGMNPLDYPGRTALVAANTLGLLGAVVTLAAVYTACIMLGWLWAGRPGTFQENFGRFVYSLVPLSIAYHFAHYLSDTLINLQYFVLALNDPFKLGANILGLEWFHVTASFQNSAAGTTAIFAAQSIAIVIGHLVGIVVAHVTAGNVGTPDPTAALRLEMPLALFMVVYTAFSLWLLSAPAIT